MEKIRENMRKQACSYKKTTSKHMFSYISPFSAHPPLHRNGKESIEPYLSGSSLSESHTIIFG